uniref:beta strand repeat-containing protein n=1 Tax=Celeribacter ethanolicus TaxID=1758178 RepID=UPI0009D78396
LELGGGTVASVTQSGGSTTVDGDTTVTGTTDINGGTFAVNSGATLTGSVDLDAAATSGTISGTVDGDVTSATDVDVASTGEVTGTLSNSGTGSSNAGTVGALVNSGGTFDNSGTVTGTTTVTGGTVTSSGDLTGGATVTGGTLDITGGTSGTLDNQSGTLDIDGGNLGAVTNASTLELGGGTVASVDNTTGTVTMTGGKITGDLDNANTMTVEGGTLSGNVTNSGTLNVAVDQTVGGDIDNSGTLALTTDGITVGTSGTLTTSGNVTTVGTGTLSAGTIVIDNAATFNGGTDLDGSVVLDGDIENAATLTVSGDMTLTGDLTNTGGLSFGAALDAGGNAITNDGGSFDVTATGSITDGGLLTNQNGGVMGFADGSTSTVSSTVNTGAGSTLTVDGTLNSAGGITNDTDATLTLGATGEITGALTNSSTFALNGGSVGAASNLSGGTMTVTGGGTVNGTLTNAETLDITSGTLTVTGGSSNSGTVDIADGTTLASDLDNSGDVTLTGEIDGNLTNRSGGTVTVDDADSAVTGTTANAGDLLIDDGAVLTAGGTVTNQSGGFIDLAGDLAGNVVNQTGGTIETTDAAGLIDGTLTSAGTIDVDSGETLTVTGLTTLQNGSQTTVEGTYLGDITLDSGASLDVDASAVLGADTDTSTIQNGGDMTLGGDVYGSLSVLNSGSLQVFDDFMLTGSLANAGNMQVETGLTISAGSSAAITNSGTLMLYSGSSIVGLTNSSGGTTSLVNETAGVASTATIASLDTSGTLDLANGVDTDVLNITGDAVINGTVEMDVDLSEGSSTGDLIAVGGNVSGNVHLSFSNSSGSLGTIDTGGITVLTYGGTSSLTVTDTSGLDTSGGLVYSLTKVNSGTGSGSYVIESSVADGVSAVASSVGLIQSLVGSVVNRPTSAFVAGFNPGENEPCGFGSWARATGGKADADGNYTDVGTGRSGTSPLSLNYGGLQAGGDYSCFGGHFNGWNLSFGGIVGVNTGSSKNDVYSFSALTGTSTDTVVSRTKTDFDQTYVGGYVVAEKDRFFADLQLRLEDTAFTSTNSAVAGSNGTDLGLTNAEYDNTGYTVSGSMGYVFPDIDKRGLNFVTTAGFSFTSSETDPINFDNGSVLELEDGKTQIGFLSGSLSKTKIATDQKSALNYFSTLTLYNDFADDRLATYTDSVGDTSDISLESLGAYGELSLGMNYTRLLEPGDFGAAKMLNATIRLDGRKGENLESWGITGQFRIQF